MDYLLAWLIVLLIGAAAGWLAAAALSQHSSTR